jgi:hypothetical protein
LHVTRTSNNHRFQIGRMTVPSGRRPTTDENVDNRASWIMYAGKAARGSQYGIQTEGVCPS